VVRTSYPQLTFLSLMMMVGKYMTQPQPSTDQHNKYSADPSCLSSWRFKENTKHKYQTQISNTKYR